MYTYIIFEVFIHLWSLFCTFHQRVDNFIGSQFSSLISWDIRKPFRDGTKHLHVVNVVAIINSLFTYKFEPVTVTAAATAATAVSLSCCCCWDTNGEVSTPLRGEASRHAGPRVLQEISKSGPNIVQEFRFHYIAFPHNSVCMYVCVCECALTNTLSKTYSHTRRDTHRERRARVQTRATRFPLCYCIQFPQIEIFWNCNGNKRSALCSEIGRGEKRKRERVGERVRKRAREGHRKSDEVWRPWGFLYGKTETPVQKVFPHVESQSRLYVHEKGDDLKDLLYPQSSVCYGFLHWLTFLGFSPASFLT